MAPTAWTWDARRHPDVLNIFSQPANDLGWCARLDSAPSTSVVGKVLCVCAAAGIAREVLAADHETVPAAIEALDRLDRWIDDPTDERFGHICGIIFSEGRGADFDAHGVVWWALRTATSTAEGYGEAGWALQTTCSAALGAGFTQSQLCAIAEQAVVARMVQLG